MIVKIRRLNLLRFIFLFLCENQLHIYSISAILILTYGKAPHVNAVLCLHFAPNIVQAVTELMIDCWQSAAHLSLGVFLMVEI
jgi:hypothetical protein